jgi:hydroxymethylpyrimidine/phosphomethylpyrimidine kinase
VKSADFQVFAQHSPTQTVLTIAGFDPSSGAGVTADLMVFAAHGLFGTSCITALTVQSTLGVRSTHPVSAEIVEDTLQWLGEDLRPVGIKLGMLGSESNIIIISSWIDTLNYTLEESKGSGIAPVVLDPVLRSTSGSELLEAAGVVALRDRLLPLVDWVTPNLEELAILSGQPIAQRDAVPDACRTLQAQVKTRIGRGCLGVLATGGHLDPPDDFLLMPSGEGLWLTGELVKTRATHGTGCAFSSAFLSRLVVGDAPEDAARGAKLYVAGALREAEEIGKGRGPMKHLWPLLR